MKGKRKNDINVEDNGEIKRCRREKDWRSVNIKKINVENNYKKIGKEKITTWTLMWFNWSVVIINATLQLLNIYRFNIWTPQ